MRGNQTDPKESAQVSRLKVTKSGFKTKQTYFLTLKTSSGDSAKLRLTSWSQQQHKLVPNTHLALREEEETLGLMSLVSARLIVQMIKVSPQIRETEFRLPDLMFMF